MAKPIRYFFDQHIDPRIAVGLRRCGIDVLTAQDAGLCGIDDPDQLAFAAAEGRVVVTFDSDFLALHASGTPHAGIVWIPAKKNVIGFLITALELVHGVYTADELINKVEYL